MLENLNPRDLPAEVRSAVKILQNLDEVHENKLRLFNVFLLELHADPEVEAGIALNKLRDYFSKNSVFAKVQSFTDSVSRLQHALKKSKLRGIRGEQLRKILQSDEFAELKNILYLQHRVLFAEDFKDHIAEFKHYLEEEGKLLGYELDLLTQTEDRLQALHDTGDVMHEFSGDTIATLMRSVIRMFLGEVPFDLRITGSTGRRTGVRTADYDLLLWLPKDAYDVLITNTDFGTFADAHARELITEDMPVKDIRFDAKFHVQVYTRLKEIAGKIIFTNGTSAEVHMSVLSDEDEFDYLTSFSGSHRDWLRFASARQKERLEQGTRAFKLFLDGADLKDSFRGAYVEYILRKESLRSFVRRVVNMFESTQNIEEVHRLLVSSGIPVEDINRFYEKNVRKGFEWDVRECKLQRFIVACQRYSESIVTFDRSGSPVVKGGRGPGFDLDDFVQFYPDHFCIGFRVKQARSCTKLLGLLRNVFDSAGFPVKGVQLANLWFFAAFGNASGQVLFEKAIGTRGLPEELPDDIREAAVGVREQPENLRDVGLVNFLRWIFDHLKPR